MKNQTFGDNRDLLKFDLVNHVMQSGVLDRFVLVPMLTPDEADKEAAHECRHEAIGGGGNQELVAFLDRCIVNEKRDIGQLEDYFKGKGFNITIYCKNLFFTNANRKSYFSGLEGDLLKCSLILIDPDKGLEEANNGEGNLLFSELGDIYQRMGDESLLMFTQRFPYELYEEYLAMRVAEIKENIPGCQPISLNDLDSIIFFLTKSKSMQDRLLQLLGEYIERYGEKEA
jgi:hypothetical protein